VALDDRYRWIYRDRVLDAVGREQTVGVGIGTGDEAGLVIVNGPSWYAAHANTIDEIAFGMQSASVVVRQGDTAPHVPLPVRGECLEYRPYRVHDLNGHTQVFGVALRQGGGIELRGPKGDWSLVDAGTAYAMGTGLVSFSRRAQGGA
jgi:hypothetical protein